MGIYAFLTSAETNQILFLGKARQTAAGGWEPHAVPRLDGWDEPRALQAMAAQRFLVSHAGKRIEVLLDHQLSERPDLEAAVEIGGDRTTDVSFSDYLSLGVQQAEAQADHRTVRELGGEVWAELQALLAEDEVAWQAKERVVDLVMGVLARHVGRVIHNDEDLPVTPLPSSVGA